MLASDIEDAPPPTWITVEARGWEATPATEEAALDLTKKDASVTTEGVLGVRGPT